MGIQADYSYSFSHLFCPKKCRLQTTTQTGIQSQDRPGQELLQCCFLSSDVKFWGGYSRSQTDGQACIHSPSPPPSPSSYPSSSFFFSFVSSISSIIPAGPVPSWFSCCEPVASCRDPVPSCLSWLGCGDFQKASQIFVALGLSASVTKTRRLI